MIFFFSTDNVIHLKENLCPVKGRTAPIIETCTRHTLILKARLKPLAKKPPNGPMTLLNRDSATEWNTNGYIRKDSDPVVCNKGAGHLETNGSRDNRHAGESKDNCEYLQ